MPTNKGPDNIYSWVDDSGITHYSNIKKETKIVDPSAKNYSFSPPNEQKQEKITAQVVQPPDIKPTKTMPNTNANGISGLIVLIAMAIGLKLLKENIEKKRKEKRRGERIRILRPEQIVKNPQIKSAPSPQSIETNFSERNLPELPSPPPKKLSWTLDLIRSLEWREFEKLCARLLETKGFHAKLGDFGPDGDGGLDIRIYKQQELERPYGIAQCKAQKQEVKIETIRAFRGVMAVEKITKGFFYTSGEFSNKAWAFGKEQKIEIVSGEELLDEIRSLPQEKQEALLQEIITTDYMTPTCTVCGVKMIKKSSPKSEYQFWSCPKYPKCRGKLELRWTDKEEQMSSHIIPEI